MNISLINNYQMYFGMPASYQMEGLMSLYNYVMIFLIAILFFVSTLLFMVIILHIDGARHLWTFYGSSSLKEFLNWLLFVRTWTHSTTLELIWTIIPTIILLVIAIPSFILLYALDEIIDAQAVIKVIAYQWYWEYEYPIILSNNSSIINISYSSYMLPFSDLTDLKFRWLLEADLPLVVPHHCNVRLIITAKDVIHSFAIPEMGVKMDAVPGWLNQITLYIYKDGKFFGQCSELCGVNHAFMPINLIVLSFEFFKEFLHTISGVTNNSINTPATTISLPINSEELIIGTKETIVVG